MRRMVETAIQHQQFGPKKQVQSNHRHILQQNEHVFLGSMTGSNMVDYAKSPMRCLAFQPHLPKACLAESGLDLC